MTLCIYSDGSSSGKSDLPTGFGYYIVRGDDVLACGFGGELKGTNNTAELRGALAGIRAMEAGELRRAGEEVYLVADSLYVLRIATGEFKAIANPELTAVLFEKAQRLGLKVRWIKGHSYDNRLKDEDQNVDSVYNNLCDKLAKAYRYKIQNELNDIKEVTPTKEQN